MPIYKGAPGGRQFLLNDVFQIDRYDNLPGFSDASADVREAVLSEAAQALRRGLATAQTAPATSKAAFATMTAG